jgi:general secretion pathway protein D
MTSAMATMLRPLLLVLVFVLGSMQAHAEDELASLNLRDVDIRVLIDTVAEATGRNFLVDPRVKAKVTLVAAKPMQKDELYDVFLSVLELHGFSAIPAGKIVKIVPDANAKQGPVPTLNGHTVEPGDQMVTQVLEVKHVSAAQLVPILRPLVPQQGHLAAYPATNVLIISDRAANIKRIVGIVRRIDLAEGDEIEVIRLSHASAAELVRVINALEQQGQQARQGASGVFITADERTNSILMSGDATARLRLRGLIAHLDTPLETGGNTQVIFLKYVKAEDMATLLQGTVEDKVQGKGQAQGAGGANVRIDIQPDEVNNALVITAPQDVLRDMRSVIRQLDIRRAQVLVEAIIAEVGTDANRELGVQFFLDSRRGTERGAQSVANFGGPGKSIISVGQDPTSLGNGLALAVGDLTEGVTNWSVLLEALAGDAATNILSTPSILTMDNQEAEIVVGKNVPFVTGQYTNTDNASGVQNPFQTIERQDVGLTLKVRPQVNEGNSILLELEQEVSSLAASSIATSDVVTNKRSIKTTVTVEDGQVVVLGGLIDDTFTDSEQKVPLLGDIPLLGHLFRVDTTKKVKQNLMVFIHPLIVRDPETASYYSGEKYSFLRTRQLQARIRERGLLKDDAARLPEDVRQLRGMLDSVHRNDTPDGSPTP